jgi:hypothetical protein
MNTNGRSVLEITAAPEKVMRFLDRFDVFYEVCPEFAIVRDHEIRQVGYVVSLYGDDERGRPLHPGDDRCREILRGLYRIAREAAPADDGVCHIDITGVDASLHYLKGGNGHGSVRLEIRILHAGAPDRPLDADQKGALEELVGRLESLGVRSGSNAPEAGRAGAGRA